MATSSVTRELFFFRLALYGIFSEAPLSLPHRFYVTVPNLRNELVRLAWYFVINRPPSSYDRNALDPYYIYFIASTMLYRTDFDS
jgi:hypothetical protein